MTRGSLRKRSVGTRPLRKKVFVFTEGMNTEPSYFAGYSRFLNQSIVEVICEPAAGAPQTLLEKARDRQKEIVKARYIADNGQNDEVWIVFDRDEHPRVSETISAAREAGIGVAFSSPCFEVWLILHFSDYDADEHHHDTQATCERTCPGYTKSKRKVPDLDSLFPLVPDAETRANAQRRRRQLDGGSSPITSVQDLIASLRSMERSALLSERSHPFG